MSLLKKIFKKEVIEEQQQSAPPEMNITPEFETIRSYNNFFEVLFDTGRYISKRDYIDIYNATKECYVFFYSLNKADTLGHYVSKNCLSLEVIQQFIVDYEQIEIIIDEYNESFIQHEIKQNKDYLDNILKEVDSNVLLDNDQRRVVLTDEDYCLVIAGAGAGKTTTLAAKVKYLVEKQEVDPKEILVISFTNKAVGELREKINRDLQIDCPITTFHSAGHAIIKKESEEKLNIRDSGFLYVVIRKFFSERVLTNKELVHKLVLFFGSYFDSPFEGDDLNAYFNYIVSGDFTTLKSNVNEYSKEIIDRRSKKKTTINNEVLKSRQEVQIANFLYMNNIDYVYEQEYPYHIKNSRKIYTPDFYITQGNNSSYIEHFGLSESGEHNRYTDDQIEKYKHAINDKVRLHYQHKTSLICTYSSYNDKRSLLDHLKEELAKKGFHFNERSSEEVFRKLTLSNDNKYISKLIKLVTIFISNFKTNGYTEEEFYRFYNTSINVRTKLFLDICKEAYLEYQKSLAEANAVDFQDMINESARLLREVKQMNEKLNFKYIIVDEYQDISRQRFDLTKELSNVTSAKVIAVGDDWQSIYAFSGSDVTLFTNFVEKMGYGKELKITSTYRNAQEVIDIAGNFVQKNIKQIKKVLISPKTINDPVIIYSYCDDFNKLEVRGLKGVLFEKAKAIDLVIGKIIALNKKEGKSEDSSILLIGRYGFDGEKLSNTEYFNYGDNKQIKSINYPTVKLEFLTAHSSKGLGYDNVIIINAIDALYGFPSQIEVDPVLKLVIKDDKAIEYAEERRLFYVALTRTKNRVFIVAPETRPSEFVMELKSEYKNVVLNGRLNKSTKVFSKGKLCPMCGYPLQLRYNPAYGIKLYMCTNENEVCNFITNHIGGQKMSIMKCDQCIDGYLIVKKSNTINNYFLGCTGYLNNSRGCNNTMSMQEYYEKYSLEEINATEKYLNNTIKSTEASVQSNHNVVKPEITKKTVENRCIEKKLQYETIQGKAFKIAEDNGDLEKTQPQYDIMVHIIKAVREIRAVRNFGEGTIISVLRGMKNKMIQEYKLFDLSCYNSMAVWRQGDLKEVFNLLYERDYLQKTEGQYPIIIITYLGYKFASIANTGK